MKKILCGVLLSIGLFFFSNNASAEYAVTVGAAYSETFGKLADKVDYTTPILLSAQYEAMPQFTAELDAYIDAYTKEESGISEYSKYQIGAGARYWIGEVVNSMYGGIGFAYTGTETKVDIAPFFDYAHSQWVSGSTTTNEYDSALVLKLGYSKIFGSGILLDAGVRYDVIGMTEFSDSPVSVYCMGGFSF